MCMMRNFKWKRKILNSSGPFLRDNHSYVFFRSFLCLNTTHTHTRTTLEQVAAVSRDNTGSQKRCRGGHSCDPGTVNS